jgi:hypothetical protein
MTLARADGTAMTVLLWRLFANGRLSSLMPEVMIRDLIWFPTAGGVSLHFLVRQRHLVALAWKKAVLGTFSRTHTSI